MISPLMHHLYEGTDEQSIRDWLVGEIEGHFGMRSEPQREGDLARDLVSWWSARSIEP